MIEIRPIRREEADRFLRLMCDVFELDHRRARSVFYTEPYFDLARKWALFDSGRMASVLTTTPLSFGFGRAVGISGVATRPEDRGQRYAGRLLEHVLCHAHGVGEGPAMLFARDPRLYRRYGFETVDWIVRGPVQSDPEWELGEHAPFEEVRARYDAWADRDPLRLRRDARRWRFWQWHFRVCSRFCDGYLASEPGVLREALYGGTAPALPVPLDTAWVGTESMAEHLSLPLKGRERESQMMTRGFPGVPLMFLTDQF